MHQLSILKCASTDSLLVLKLIPDYKVEERRVERGLLTI